ncbi:MAG: glycosyltransferase family 4 protein [Verrucomicrobia bacterium]|jgi:glycosyltransferase involved in cell wall biosynthesis|nr:glycosyltransferase family 4 protein [Verrucomicrobiota bacterium]MBT7065005.1 glycosyltransferase family 4 protein [Verrucomicrobiota bacterium]MBT7700485.1 glycosyltransferase family 4 protein [Verrucomicrobiota bacterium]
MKVAYIIPGTGGAFYCENCVRDLSLVRGLAELGHEVCVVPMYLPVMPDEPHTVPESPVFYGAVRLYFEHCWPGLRWLPFALRSWLDSAPFLRLAARRAGSTRAEGLEDLTLSMLRGEEGGQAFELERVVRWLKREVQPDVVHISNGLLLGLARRLSEELDARIVCSLQDEDAWVDAMPDEFAEQVWSLMSERAAEVTCVPVSQHYAARVGPRLGRADGFEHVVPLGVDTTRFHPPAARPVRPVIGYLSRLHEGLGLGVLVNAFILLKQSSECQDARLRLAGGSTGEDAAFIKAIRQQLWRAGVMQDVDIVEAFDPASRAEFLQSLTLLSVPMPHGEAFGLFQLEAMACGVPVVQPAVGGFPEVAELTGGSRIYEPNDAAMLAATWKALLVDPAQLEALGQQGLTSVRNGFTIKRMAERMSDVYTHLHSGPDRHTDRTPVLPHL